jgi:argininosuccinate synthase
MIKSGKQEEKKRVVLAFSGGLDTSCILKWLIDKGYEVVCFAADVGQQLDNIDEVKAKALKIGASAVHVVDVRREFVTDFVFPTIKANAAYERVYLLGTSIARPVIAKAQVQVAHLEKCKFLSHGATGKGNDQVRFEGFFEIFEAF